MVQPPSGRYMLVVCRDTGSDEGAPLPPLQPGERPTDSPLESGGKGDELESRQMPTRAGLCAVFHARVRSSGYGLLGGYRSWEVSAQMIGGMVWSRRRG